MRAEEKNMVERIMDTETMGYAYEYPYGGGARKEYMLALTPENLANFIGARGFGADPAGREGGWRDFGGGTQCGR